ncbi:Methyl-accepting chemotaxis protein (MCP) signalling domain-containing protein [Atopomonas hussainii]|uniref:Methyl-accepting chemotaxis protein (MCP) signalling domain-containing protein n=1 Tax=Atopomonas hussainii TaxID=1429083 RepID=A0A1H7SCD1_9GAMM|nr:methyl-accepting chemotaxis protein [Atopomonas hussainii]SEL69856.1 Methyl-accepting chemotaxis protein (MCP) signalling domain-containing protein [Atopomonas hussainii]
MPASQTPLRQVVGLREEIKTINSIAFQVNLLGLNAILLAKQFGEVARGFGVISAELRAFSKQLASHMQAIAQHSVNLVSLETQGLCVQKRHRLLCSAHGRSTSDWLIQAQQRQQGVLSNLQAERESTFKHMREFLGEAYQTCLFGTVIARSARIEAAYAGNQGMVLTTTSLDFSSRVDQVLASLDRLKQATGG